jgi:DNA-binding transcriptional ArsR family regulator
LIVPLEEIGSPQIEELNLLHANICQALGDIKRIQILYILHEKPRRVSDLVDELEVPQPTVSRHLALLRQRSLVTSERNGTEAIYHLTDPRIIDVLNEMRILLRDVLDRQSNAISWDR